MHNNIIIIIVVHNYIVVTLYILVVIGYKYYATGLTTSVTVCGSIERQCTPPTTILWTAITKWHI